MNTSSVIITYHEKIDCYCDREEGFCGCNCSTDCVGDYFSCECSEEEGSKIHEKYFQINDKIEGEYNSYHLNGNVN